MITDNIIDEESNEKQIGDYTICEEIGSGGFAKVAKGIHIPTGEKVAIKIMDKNLLYSDPLNYRRVKSEISILKIVRHKNIIKLYEVIETPQKLYLITEYCEGGELFDYIVAKQCLPEKQACEFFHEIIDALEYLHSINIVHRDIKPENLLLDKFRKKTTLKLIDFGISNIYTPNSLLITPCGTASYAPPEMHKGKKYYGLLTDIWSAGVVLFAMVFGYLPFCEDNEEKNIENIIKGNYEIPAETGQKLTDFLKHLLDINPLTRFDLEQIKSHPWYNIIPCSTERPGLIIGYHKIPVDERIISICESYGYLSQNVRNSVLKNNYDNNSAIYYIVLSKMKKLGIDSISDLYSNEYLKYIYNINNVILSNNCENKNNKDKNAKSEKKGKNEKNKTNSKDFMLSTTKGSFTENKGKINNNEIIHVDNIDFIICTKDNSNFKNSISDKKNAKNIVKNLKYKKNYNKLFNISSEKEKNNNSTTKKNTNRGTSKNNKKKEKKVKKIQSIQNSEKINNKNAHILHSINTCSLDSKFKICLNNNLKNKDNERKNSFTKTLTDDIKEIILKMRNPRKKTTKINEVKLKMQLRLNKNKIKIQDKKCRKNLKRFSIFKNGKGQHTIIHNRNASATATGRHKRNQINNLSNENNENISNLEINKVRDFSSSPFHNFPKNNISCNNSYIKRVKKYCKYKNKYKKNNNSSIVTKNSNVSDNDDTIMCSNYNEMCINNKQNSISKNNNKMFNSLPGYQKFKNKLTPKKEEINYAKVIKTSKIPTKNRQTFPVKKMDLIHYSYNDKNNITSISKSKKKFKEVNSNKKPEKMNLSIYNIDEQNIINQKINLTTCGNKEYNDSISFMNNTSKLTKYISPLHKKSHKKFYIKNNLMNNSVINNTSICKVNKNISFDKNAALNHYKYGCNKLKIKNKNLNNLNISSAGKCYNRNKKDKVLSLISFEDSNKSNKNVLITEISQTEQNYKSNYMLTNNNSNNNYNIDPKKYRGPIIIKNIIVEENAIKLSEEITFLLKKNNINFWNVNPFKIYCRKNSEKYSISIYNIAGEINFNNEYNYKKEDVNITEPNDKYCNTNCGGYYKKNKQLFYVIVKPKLDNYSNKATSENINRMIINKYNNFGKYKIK